MLGRKLERGSALVDWLIAQTEWSERQPIVPVIEFPRSGGTWIADMLADYFEVPFPKHNLFPLGCAGILHGHWRYTYRFGRVVYVYRDGRDVLVSRYWNLFGGGLSTRDHLVNRLLFRRYDWVDGDTRFGAIEDHLVDFIEDWYQRPRSVRVPWDRHVSEWLSAGDEVVSVSYEEMQDRPQEALGRIVSELSGEPADPWRIEVAVEKFRFERQTGRERGEADAGANKRKGVVGDWKNCFSRDVGRKFERYCGSTLRSLGYAQEQDWWKRL